MAGLMGFDPIALREVPVDGSSPDPDRIYDYGGHKWRIDPATGIPRAIQQTGAHLGDWQEGGGLIPEYGWATDPLGTQNNPYALDQAPGNVYKGKLYQGPDQRLFGLNAQGQYEPLREVFGLYNEPLPMPDGQSQIQSHQFRYLQSQAPANSGYAHYDNSKSGFWDAVLPAAVMAIGAYTGAGLAGLAGSGGAAGAGATGAGSSGAAAAGGGEAAAGSAAAGESLVGPATGTILPAGTAASGATSYGLGSAAAPTVSGVAAGAGPFVSAGGASTGGAMATDNLTTPDWLQQLLSETGEAGVDAGSLEGGFNPAAAGGIFDSLPSLSKLYNIYNSVSGLFGNGGGGLGGGATLDAVAKDPNWALRVLPGAMALGYAALQPGVDTSGLSSVSDALRGNQNAVIKAATDPLQRNIAMGYGDLLQSQALRGIRGSSFGDTDIANYISNTGSALANAGANAAQGSLALQGDLASRIAALKNENQKIKNQLYGTAFDVLGRGLNPQGYAANLGVVPATRPVATTTPSAPSDASQLLGLARNAKDFYDIYKGIFG